MRIRVLLAALAAMTLIAAPAAAQDGDTGTVTVIHGVPGLTVDVWVNGDPTLEGFEPGTITDPLELPAGDYEIEIYPAGTDPEGEDPAIAGATTLPAGANASIIAHLAADGTPTLGVFVNDTSEIAPGETRLAVRHTAAAPAVDVRAGGDVVFGGLSNPDEATADIPAGTVSADVVLAGEGDPVLGPADLNLAEGSATLVYAIGSAEDGSLDLLVQSIGGLGGASAPAAVESGTGGQAATSPTMLALVGMILGALLVLGAGARLATARR